MYLRVSNQSEEECAHGLNEVDNFRNRSVPFEAEVANGMAGLREEIAAMSLKTFVFSDLRGRTYVDERQNE